MSDIHQNDVAVGLHLVVTTRTMADASREFGPLLSKLEPKRCALHRSSEHGHHEFDLLTGTTGSVTRRTLRDMETWSDRVLTSLGLASDYHILFDPDEGWTVEDCSKSPEEAALIHPSCIHYHLRATIGFDPWDVDSR
ncbi:hypothetical protein FHR84_001934 [Actinopolyspora biskrensis]|uniref:Uncharacterized protein n=1 Tax=Actinopolyspora biskrensis TaxID=1470178 RepID=A0A852YYK5_9ACTN|nr:hypothetical protein [Actinopolyspora biskrensis]NYH78609.1 hypothetical protein [Actinopolyspora biskrensis]